VLRLPIIRAPPLCSALPRPFPHCLFSLNWSFSSPQAMLSQGLTLIPLGVEADFDLGFRRLYFALSHRRSCAIPHQRVLGPEKRRAFLDMSRLGGHSQIAHSQETFRGLRGHSYDFHGVKFGQLQVRQDLLDSLLSVFCSSMPKTVAPS
jgi:hypothetical protein